MTKRTENWIDKKRIVLIVPDFPQRSETFIVSKFLGLLARSWDAHIVCNRSDKNKWATFPQLDAIPQARRKVHKTWPHQPRWLAGLLFIPGLLYCLVTSPKTTGRYLVRGWGRYGWGVLRHFYLDIPLIRLQPDILHFEFGSLAGGRTHLKECLKTRFSVSFRGYDLNFVALDDPDHYHKVWETVDACHFLSENLWLRAQQRGCPIDVPHTLIPPALDLRLFPEPKPKIAVSLGTPQEPLHILSVGRLEWKKGYEHALMAIKLLIDSGVNCEYQTIGDGEYTSPLYFACHQLRLDGFVEFSGPLPHDEVLNHLARADVFLHPSLSEGFCNAVLEAQAMGMPVVCTDAGGLPENVEDGVTGFIVPRRDPTAMADKLALLAKDGELRQRMGAAGRLRVETHYRIDQQLDAFERFYDQL